MIDSIAGRFLLWLFSFFYKRQSGNTQPTIAVCKFYGMGSIIQSTLLLAQIKNKFPTAKIIFITSEGNKEIAEKISLIDEILTVDDKGLANLLCSTNKLIKNLRQKRLQAFYDIETHSFFSAIVAMLSRASSVISMYGLNTKAKRNYADSSAYFNGKRKMNDVFAELCNIKSNDAILYDFKTSASLHSPSLSDKIKEKKYVLININASSLRIERRWPLQNFRNLIVKLSGAFNNLNFVLTGSESEKEYVQKLVNALPEQVSSLTDNTAGLLNHYELIQLISRSELIITNDTGPMHLALAIQKPVVALFGPNNPDAYQFKTNDVVIYKNVSCSPCVHIHHKSPCNGNNICMKNISVDEVFQKCAQQLSVVFVTA